MFSAEAARLAAIEVVTPYAALIDGTGFPTLAGKHVYDSRAAAIGDLDETLAYTPVLSFYTAATSREQRGPFSGAGDNECEAVLEFVAELAVAAQDDDGTTYVDAMAGTDPDARLVLAALVAQVIHLLTESEAGYLFRRIVGAVKRIEEEPFAVPNLGLRWQRTTVRMTLLVPQDDFPSAGGLPQPVRELAGHLPQGSYARTKLDALAAAFAGEPRAPLTELMIRETADANPIASVELT